MKTSKNKNINIVETVTNINKHIICSLDTQTHRNFREIPS